MEGSWRVFRPGERWSRSPHQARVVLEVPGVVAAQRYKLTDEQRREISALVSSADGLSDVARRVMAEPDFDAEKIETIRKAIAEGKYPLDPRRIAESFASLERLIGDRNA